LESSIIQAVESGFMTKDLAICVYDTNDVPKDKYLNTLGFIQKVASILRENLNKK
jgi:isocitrate dehydrogenase